MTTADAQLAELAAQIRDHTLCTALLQTARAHGSQSAYSDKMGKGATIRTWTWERFRNDVLDLAAGLLDHDVARGARVAIMLPNRVEHLVADAAAVHAGCVPVSIYPTLSSEQIAEVVGACSPSVLVVESDAHLARWRPVLDSSGIELIIVLDETVTIRDPRIISWQSMLCDGVNRRAFSADGCELRWRTVRPDDPLTIIFTSGTTGPPKGVVLTHENILYEVHAMVAANGLDDPGTAISYLPFAHIAERILSMYLPQSHGGHVRLIADAAEVATTLCEVRPTRFFGVPRIWEKIQASLNRTIEAEGEATKRSVAQAMWIGQQYVEARQFGRQPTADQEEAFLRADDNTLAELRAAAGLDRLEWATTAAAPMPEEVLRFFTGLGMEMYDVYGMTETSATVTANTRSAFRLGSVGRPLPGIEIAIAEDGEVLVRGPVVTPGYYHDEAATADLVDSRNWLCTGDIGRIDDDGFLYIVGRKKEIIITSSGKNIAPAGIEGFLTDNEIIDSAMVHGDGRPFLVALVTLDRIAATRIARGAGIPDGDQAQLTGQPEILAAVQQSVAQANNRVSRPEQVKKFVVVDEQWTIEGGELTPTLKLRRAVVTARHADKLDRLYE
jgi:long-chain acyl-CoA synthetase